MVGVQVSAQDLFRAAYENRYTWDKNFPGYTADVTYTNGETVITGKITVSADLKPTVEVEDEEARKAIHNQLFEVAIHRVRRSFEDTHSKNTFSYGEPDAGDPDGTTKIIIGGKGEGDHYKLRNNEVCHVHRHIHGVVVTIDTFSSHDTGAGYLSHTYDSIYHDPQTGEQKGGYSTFEDNYTQVGSYHILSQRLIKTEGEADQVFEFANIDLLA
ncbi:MAG: DUF3386 domain-containing protein [Leptolyngbyaceae bacterium]|nr:DUF3386 domain-containing protein [Leptolyngbyaceae bacterium]